jgi:uracil-DNA glycosylase
MWSEIPPLSSGWQAVLRPLQQEAWFQELCAFVEDERRAGAVYPPSSQTFTALRETPLETVRVLLLGQDPYHQEGQAHGLSFSVSGTTPIPPSLRNMFQELHADLGIPRPEHGSLLAWAHQGVLLLNTVLTVRRGQPGSHRKRGWERVTDCILTAVSQQPHPVVFLLWGADAQRKRTLVDENRHRVITSAHPSPLSAHRGFWGSRPFSRTNAALREAGRGEIDWRLPPAP